MIVALISKDTAKRVSAAAEFIAASGARQVIYICPKNIIGQAEPLHGRALVVPFEDMTKTETWLRINAMIGAQTALIMDNVARYPKITSDKVLHLQRLSMQLQHKMVSGNVPFTLGIEYIYTPYSYLDRAILGFAHWYAFRENYKEMDEFGTIHHAHDFDVLAAKVAGVTDIDYERFTMPRQTLSIASKREEQAEYNALRKRLFDSEESPQKIITQLSDLTHAFKTRTDAVLALCAGLDGKTLVITNLSSYATRYNSAFKKAGLSDCEARSYQTAAGADDIRDMQNVVYAEAPIVRSYFLLDIEAAISPSANVWTVRGDIKVDQYLHSMLDAELGAIDGFVAELGKIKRGKVYGF